jgi:DNA-binding transcriptional LysR family regulator
MERAYHQVELNAGESSPVSTGLVRIGCTEGYGSTILPRHLAKFQQVRPGIQIDLLVLPRAIQLPRNEADLVITIDRPARGAYMIVKLSDYGLGLYGSRGYLDQASSIGSVSDLRSHPIIGYVDYFSVAKDLPFLNTPHGKLGRGMNSTSLLAQREAVIEGAGLAILPHYLVRDRADICQVLPDDINFTRTYWLISPTELRDSIRVKAVSEFLRKAAADEEL